MIDNEVACVAGTELLLYQASPKKLISAPTFEEKVKETEDKFDRQVRQIFAGGYGQAKMITMLELASER